MWLVCYKLPLQEQMALRGVVLPWSNAVLLAEFMCSARWQAGVQDSVHSGESHVQVWQRGSLRVGRLLPGPHKVSEPGNDRMHRGLAMHFVDELLLLAALANMGPSAKSTA